MVRINAGYDKRVEDDVRGTQRGVRRRQGVRGPVNIGWDACFQGVRKASGTPLDPSGLDRGREILNSGLQG